MLQELEEFVKKTMPDLPYHNFNHAKQVRNSARFYGLMEGVGADSVFQLEAAGLAHDAWQVPGDKYNEEKTVVLLNEFMQEKKYPLQQIRAIDDLILATKMPSNPKNIKQMIICDADLDYLGTESYPLQAEALRRELGMEKELWYERLQLEFLKGHEYYTPTAQQIRQPIVDIYCKLYERAQYLKRLK